MEKDEPMKYVKTIVLEIVERSRVWFNREKKKKFDVARFNVREAAYAFLRQYDGENLVKAQKITVCSDNQELYLCVRDLVYGKIEQASSTIVEFIYRKGMFSEIKWPGISVNRVRWVNENDGETSAKKVPEIIQFDGAYSSINVDSRIVSSDTVENDQSLAKNSTEENTDTSLSRVQRSVSGFQQLINVDDGSATLDHDTDRESHFRSSIYIHINQNRIS